MCMFTKLSGSHRLVKSVWCHVYQDGNMHKRHQINLPKDLVTLLHYQYLPWLIADASTWTLIPAITL